MGGVYGDEARLTETFRREASLCECGDDGSPEPFRRMQAGGFENEHDTAIRLRGSVQPLGPLGIPVPGEINVDGENGIEATHIQLLELRLPRIDGRVPLPARCDHLGRPIDRQDLRATGEHQSGGDTVTAADLEDQFPRLRGQQLDGPAVARSNSVHR